MINEIYEYQFPVFKTEAVIIVFAIFVALLLANALWETTVEFPVNRLYQCKPVRNISRKMAWSTLRLTLSI